jgi:hypothetical protein
LIGKSTEPTALSDTGASHRVQLAKEQAQRIDQALGHAPSESKPEVKRKKRARLKEKQEEHAKEDYTRDPDKSSSHNFGGSIDK